VSLILHDKLQAHFFS